MKKITRQSLANSASARWDDTYGRGGRSRHIDDNLLLMLSGALFIRISDEEAIGVALRKLGSEPNPDAVDAAIGNTSWTSVPSCDECNRRDLPFVIEVGQEPDYESHTASLCIDCIAKAAVLAQSS